MRWSAALKWIGGRLFGSGLLGSPWLLAVCFLISFGAGGWLVYQVGQGLQADEYQQKLADLEETRQADRVAIVGLYEDKLRIARSQVKTREVIRYVEDSRECDIPEPVGRMLDARRQGVPEATNRTPTDTRDAAGAAAVSQRQELAAHADLADRFQACRSQLIRLNQWYTDRE